MKTCFGFDKRLPVPTVPEVPPPPLPPPSALAGMDGSAQCSPHPGLLFTYVYRLTENDRVPVPVKFVLEYQAAVAAPCELVSCPPAIFSTLRY